MEFKVGNKYLNRQGEVFIVTDIYNSEDTSYPVLATPVSDPSDFICFTLQGEYFWFEESDQDLIAEYVEEQEITLKPKIEVNQKPSNPKDEIGIRKVPMSVVPANVLAEVAAALLEGASKYGRHNYREVGVRESVYYDATMRHLMAWWEGEDIDPDSGLSHVTKAITSLIVLRDSMMQGNSMDDRPPKSKDFYPQLNQLCDTILTRNADKTPKHVTEKNKVI